jgi:hypothetical protein
MKAAVYPRTDWRFERSPRMDKRTKKRSVKFLLTLDPSDIAYWLVRLSKFI